MNNTISYTRLQDDSAVYKVTIRKQLTAMQMRGVKGHLYNNPYYEWEEDKQRYRLGDGLYMRFGANNDQSVYWDIVLEKDEDGEYEELDFYGYSNPESGIRDLMREWDLHSYDPAQQFSVRSVTLQAMVELETDVDLSWYACINLTNADTIEFRVFRGTLKYNTVIATLQFVANLCRVAISLPEYRIQEFSWPALIEALTQNDCPELVQYLKERNLYVNEPVAAEREV